MKHDYAVIKELAQHYAEVAADSRNDERGALHTAVNDLRMIRPVVLIDEIPWSEFRLDELEAQCENELLRRIETYMRRTLYQWEHFPADMIIPPYIPVPAAVSTTGIGIETDGDVISAGDGHVASRHYDDQLADEEAIEKLRIPVITHDESKTQEHLCLAAEALGGAVAPKAVGPLLFCEPADLLMQYHGMDNLLVDLIDRPEFVHSAMSKLTDIFLGTLKQYEALGLLDPHPPSIHCTCARTGDLPQPDFDGSRTRLSDTWGRGMAQVFATVSAAMHDEFDITYMKRAMEPFGLVYYGCCEPLHGKLHILEQIPHLRKISISPWADMDVAAESIGKKYVFAAKVLPSNVAGPSLDIQTATAEIKHILAALKRGNCSGDIVLKDISTVGYNPHILEQWEKRAMELVNNW